MGHYYAGPVTGSSERHLLVTCTHTSSLLAAAIDNHQVHPSLIGMHHHHTNLGHAELVVSMGSHATSTKHSSRSSWQPCVDLSMT